MVWDPVLLVSPSLGLGAAVLAAAGTPDWDAEATVVTGFGCSVGGGWVGAAATLTPAGAGRKTLVRDASIQVVALRWDEYRGCTRAFTKCDCGGRAGSGWPCSAQSWSNHATTAGQYSPGGKSTAASTVITFSSRARLRCQMESPRHSLFPSDWSTWTDPAGAELGDMLVAPGNPWPSHLPSTSLARSSQAPPTSTTAPCVTWSQPRA
mmetsp:Transcript_7008/g.17297  ORF Transcript_7008/g.17297 Transcript_7008/m.17297 type:complete len:208 (-) Transcript_7008:1162-1785(-)